LDKLKHHKIDFLLKSGPPPYEYYVSDESPKGYVLEHMFMASLVPPETRVPAEKKEIKTSAIRYIDWLFPGILAMNMMFSALWGVGYVVVRYRKNGVLKRLKVTPLTAFEYLSAQALSRIFLLMFTLSVVWIGCDLIFSFTVLGSYFDLFLVFSLGSLSLTALGLVLASRGTSEEFTTGILNFISWPMMFLSEVWFSLEGAPQWVKSAAQIFPLTHLLTAARKIMHDGAGLADISLEIIVLTLMTLAFLTIGASMFSWNK
jgi:ABC-type multidrug transport system permease subunit